MPNIAYLDFYYEKTATINKIYDNALVLTALEDDTVFNINVSEVTVQLNISYDNGMTWTALTLTSGYELDPINAGENIMITGTNDHYLSGLSFDTDDGAGFNVSGNIMTLLDADNYKTMTTIPYTDCFSELFSESSVVDASYLTLPATTLSDYCYYRMFYGCDSLINPPSLPATTLAPYCYHSMFMNCTSLNIAPSLPATTLSNYCYVLMFDGCTSLTVSPKLPATTLASGCYNCMFANCSSLTVAPVLTATTLANVCYSHMFDNCISLVNPPELPATTLAINCYSNMFHDCTSIVNAPILPATTLANNCYLSMFDGCTSLNYIKVFAVEGPNGDTNLAQYCTNWVRNVAETGTFIKDANAAFIVDSISGIPIGWTVYNEGEVIIHQFDITVEVDPEGSGVAYGNGVYDIGQLVILTAVPAEGYIFDGWYWEDNLQSTNTTWSHIPLYDPEIGYAITYTAKFIVDPTVYYNVTLDQDPEIGATLIGADRYVENTIVTVSASDVSGYNFLGWYNGNQFLTGNNTFTFTITEDTYLTAKYAEVEPDIYYTVTTNVEPTAAGTVTGGGQYLAGSYATINAYPATGYNFEYILKDGNIVSYDPTYTFKVDYDTTISAAFSVILGYENDYLTFESIKSTQNPIKIYMSSVGTNATTASIQYSYNDGKWYSVSLYNGYNTIMNLNNTDTIRFRNFRRLNTNVKIKFDIGLCNVYGNIMSIWPDYTDDEYTTDKNYFCVDVTELLSLHSFEGIFTYCGIVDAHNLILPAITLSRRCYANMFNNCRYLGTPPALPATTLADYCYDSMFASCWSLTGTPTLPATTLADYCYKDMFDNCTSLTIAPVLPATTLADYCYFRMFGSCTALEIAPELPTTTLTNGCYMEMFEYCSSLNEISCLATDISASDCTNAWVYGVASSGTFTKAASMTSWTTGERGIPEGWTVVNAS